MLAKTHTLTVAVPETIYRQMTTVAEWSRCGVEDVVTDALRAYLSPIAAEDNSQDILQAQAGAKMSKPHQRRLKTLLKREMERGLTAAEQSQLNDLKAEFLRLARQKAAAAAVLRRMQRAEAR
jgi:hypothetical protein